MANHYQNGGRNVAVPDENRPSWRPQDQTSGSHRARGNEDDHDYRSWRERNYREDERAMSERDPRRWEGSRGSELGHPEDRDLGRSTEQYGQGQSGYGAGRYADRSLQTQTNEEMRWRSPGSFEDRPRDFGTDDRFSRGGSWEDRTGYEPERYGAQGGYGGGRGFEAERLGVSRGHDPRGYDQRGYDQRGYDQRMGYQRGYDPRGHEPQRMGYQGNYDRGHDPRGYEQRRRYQGSYDRDDDRGYDARGHDPRMGARSNIPGMQEVGYQGGFGPGSHEGSQGYDPRMAGQGYGRGTQQDAGYQGSSYGRESSAAHEWSPYGPIGGREALRSQRSGGFEPPGHRGIGPHRGKGPQGYQRSDDRIREMVCEALADDDQIDASQIHVAVKDGEVTLTGTVDSRRLRRDAEDCVAAVSGVRDVQVQLRVRDERASEPAGRTGGGSGMSPSGTSQSAGQSGTSQSGTSPSAGQSGTSHPGSSASSSIGSAGSGGSSGATGSMGSSAGASGSPSNRDNAQAGSSVGKHETEASSQDKKHRA